MTNKLTTKFIREFERAYRASFRTVVRDGIVQATPIAPKPAPMALAIASWPTKQKSTLTGIGKLHKGPSQVYRVW